MLSGVGDREYALLQICYIFKHKFGRLPRASKSQIRASILKDQEITVARIVQLFKTESVLWTCNFQYKKYVFFFLMGASKSVIWASVFSLNLYSTCPNEQVVIKIYLNVAPCLLCNPRPPPPQ